MNAVWKFPLDIVDEQEIGVPAGAQWLDARVQRGVLCLWALVDPTAPPAKATVRIAGTGHERDDLLANEYIASFHLDGGGLVFHIFAREARS